MAVTLTREFYTNGILFIVALVALVLSILAFAKPCKKDKFKNDDEPIIFHNEKICRIFTHNNRFANWYCRGFSGECSTDEDCPDDPFLTTPYSCLCPGSNNTNCKQKVCKVESSLPYCIPGLVSTPEGKTLEWEVECN